MVRWKRISLAWALAAATPLGAVATVPATAFAQSSSMTPEEFQSALADLDNPLPEPRIAALDAIGRRGSRHKRDASMKLRQLLTADPDARVRAAAGRAIGRLFLRDALPDLIRALSDESSDVRFFAAAALWRLPDPSAVPALIVGLLDSDARVREHCALAVGVTNDARAALPLAALLRDPVESVRLEAARSIARIADPGPMDALTAVAQDASASDDLRIESITAIASVPGPDKTNVLVRLLEVADLDVRAHVVLALGQVGDALVIPALRRAGQRPGSSRLQTPIRDAIANIQRRSAAPDAGTPAAPDAGMPVVPSAPAAPATP